MCEKASHDQGRQLLRPATIHHCPTMLPATIRHYPRIDMGKHLCGGPSVAARNQSSVAAHNQHPPRRPCKSGSAGRLFMQVPHLRGACHVDRTLPAFTSGEKDPDSPIHVALFRPDAGTMTPPAPFAPPLDDAQLDDLRWYLEVLATWPTGPDYERAELGARAAVEFLYPPTLKALSDRLSDRKAALVHVVHFDGHGVYDADMGLGYLLFEDNKHAGDRVDANRLGTLLNRCGVPLMVLNACQSAAQQEANPYASVAARLIRAGVGSVLAMNYSVLVVAARKFVAAFYANLADGLTIGQALDQGRRALLADEQRHILTRHNAQGELAEETIRLRDWFLPALYQQAADPTVFDAAAPLPEGAQRAVPLVLTNPSV